MRDRPAPPQVVEQERLLGLARALLPQSPEPYLGYLVLETGKGRQTVLLSTAARAGRELTIVDWRRSPLTEVLLGCAEGERYEVQVEGRALEGLLVEKGLVRFEGGALAELRRGASVLSRGRDDAWRERVRRLPRLAPRPRGERRREGPWIDFELDAAQRRVVELPAGVSTLVLGEAGCGKTTVALHRLARLRRTRGAPRSCVIVPTEGLRRLTALLLERLGVAGVDVWTYDRWAARQARRAFPDLPERDGQGPGASTVALKRHPALREALRDLAAQPPALPEEDEPTVPSDAHARRHDLQRLFGDTAILERVVRAAGLTTRAVGETFEHTRVQFTRTAEDEYADVVDASRLAALDGRSLDAGTPTEDAASLDAEDCAVLFELDRLRALRAGVAPTAPEPYGCIVLDEAQELAPLELALVGRSLAPGGTLIVAGDADQQIDPAAHFLGWPATLGELGARDFETATLERSYRCPPEVTALARGVLDPAAFPSLPPPARSPVTIARFGCELHQLAWLTGALREVQARDPGISVAVIARSAEEARRLAPLLRRGVLARLALDGHFTFRAGIAVTCVEEVKGLEFDVAIVPDARPEAYPDLPAARRSLYVAATRPTRRLVLSTVGDWSPLLPFAAR